MSSSFRFLEGIAVADAAFEAVGDSPSELFVAAARAVNETMVDPATVSNGWCRSIRLEAEELSDLLFDWLSEIVYEKDASAVVLRDVAARVEWDGAAGRWRLEGQLEGAGIDPGTQDLRADIKAVTKHRYEVRQDGGRWMATVVLDI